MPELNWLGDQKARRAARHVQYRLLQPVSEVGAPDSDNLLIQGDNLDALKSLLPLYAGRVKCIFIDPPYNTRSAFEHYDDNLEHSQWLSMMYPRLVLLRELLSEDGSIWVTIDDNEAHYLKVMMDEVFGRGNFINQIAVKTKNTAGASGGGEDKKLKKNIETVLVYVKKNDSEIGFKKFNDVFEEVDLFELIKDMEDDGKSWKYTSVLLAYGEELERRSLLTGDGEEIVVRKFNGVKRTTVARLEKDGESQREVYSKNFEWIFSDTNAQTSIRTKIMDEFKDLSEDELLIASYVPRSGRDRGRMVEHFYISPTIRRVIWLKDTAVRKKNSIVKREKLGTLWTKFNWNNVTKEGEVRLPNGKKPEALLRTVFELATAPGDLVLDSFLGSGTTAAVAHKMGRRWIGIEMGAHAETHCLPRLTKVVEGEQGGVSEAVGWQGGGGFRFMRLGEPVFDADGRIREDVRFAPLAAYLWFLHTRTPWADAPAPGARKTPSPVLGLHGDTAVVLLYNGVLGDRRPQAGNVLTHAVFEDLRARLPQHDGPWLIYGEACRLGPATLKRFGIAFNQIPYDIRRG